jgi:hypothetical protein
VGGLFNAPGVKYVDGVSIGKLNILTIAPPTPPLTGKPKGELPLTKKDEL